MLKDKVGRKTTTLFVTVWVLVLNFTGNMERYLSKETGIGFL